MKKAIRVLINTVILLTLVGCSRVENTVQENVTPPTRQSHIDVPLETETPRTNREITSTISVEEGEQKATTSGSWNSYQSDRLKFSIIYPSHWDVIETGAFDILLYSPDLYYEGASLEQGAEIWISRLNYPNGMSLDEIVEQEKSQRGTSVSTMDFTLASGLPAKKLVMDNKTLEVFVWIDEKQYLNIRLIYSEEQRHQEFETIFTRVLNSLDLLR